MQAIRTHADYPLRTRRSPEVVLVESRHSVADPGMSPASSPAPASMSMTRAFGSWGFGVECCDEPPRQFYGPDGSHPNRRRTSRIAVRSLVMRSSVARCARRIVGHRPGVRNDPGRFDDGAGPGRPPSASSFELPDAGEAAAGSGDDERAGDHGRAGAGRRNPDIKPVTDAQAVEPAPIITFGADGVALEGAPADAAPRHDDPVDRRERRPGRRLRPGAVRHLRHRHHRRRRIQLPRPGADRVAQGRRAQQAAQAR